MPLVGFEHTTAGERPQIYALEREATGIGIYPVHSVNKSCNNMKWDHWREDGFRLADNKFSVFMDREVL